MALVEYLVFPKKTFQRSMITHTTQIFRTSYSKHGIETPFDEHSFKFFLLWITKSFIFTLYIHMLSMIESYISCVSPRSLVQPCPPGLCYVKYYQNNKNIPPGKRVTSRLATTKIVFTHFVKSLSLTYPTHLVSSL